MNGISEGPGGRITVKGKINNRKDQDKPRREILINEKGELARLPIKCYPLTHRITPEGLAVVLVSNEGTCEASFHRYLKENRYGEHVYIGSATQRLKDISQAQLFGEFLIEGGVFTPDMEVKLDFECNDQIIQVYISRL